jgi:S1-C subfamily serine protease
VKGMLARATPRPMLGVELRAVRVRRPVISDESSVAWLVLSVEPRGAAARAGIMQGDVLLGHAGRPFATRADLATLLRDAGPGGALRFDVGRGGRALVCEVVMGEAFSGDQRAA